MSTASDAAKLFRSWRALRAMAAISASAAETTLCLSSSAVARMRSSSATASRSALVLISPTSESELRQPCLNRTQPGSSFGAGRLRFLQGFLDRVGAVAKHLRQLRSSAASRKHTARTTKLAAIETQYIPCGPSPIKRPQLFHHRRVFELGVLFVAFFRTLGRFGLLHQFLAGGGVRIDRRLLSLLGSGLRLCGGGSLACSCATTTPTARQASMRAKASRFRKYRFMMRCLPRRPRPPV